MQKIEQLLPTWVSRSDGCGEHGRRRSSLGHLHNELTQEVARQRTVLSDPQLLRGAPFPLVVAGFGRLLEPNGTIAASGGADAAEDTFVLSQPVTLLDHFLSHSWRDSAKLKWLSLLWHVNMPFAVFAGHLAALLSFIVILTWPSLWPAIITVPGTDITMANGPCAAIGLWTFLVALLFGHSVSGVAPDLFLDKICIHQTDPELKAAGIRALGAYLRRSKSMLVLWGEDYFDRLWCCYELSLFILLRGVSAVHVLPITHGANAALVCLLFAISMTMGAIVEVHYGNLFNDPTFLTLSLILLLAPLCMIAWYKASVYEARMQLKRMLTDFEIRNVSCFCCQVDHVLPNGDNIPCDREFVEEGIGIFFGKNGQPSRDGLDEFNNVVRTQLHASIDSLLGKETVLPWPLLLIVGSLLAWVAPCNIMLSPKPLENNIYFAFDVPWMIFVFLVPDALAGFTLRLMSWFKLPGRRICSTLVFLVVIVPAFSPDLVFQHASISPGTKVAILIGGCGLGILLRAFSK